MLADVKGHGEFGIWYGTVNCYTGLWHQSGDVFMTGTNDEGFRKKVQMILDDYRITGPYQPASPPESAAAMKTHRCRRCGRHVGPADVTNIPGAYHGGDVCPCGEVENFDPLPESASEPDQSWRDAIGCAPAVPGSISAEEAIRRVRGGEPEPVDLSGAKVGDEGECRDGVIARLIPPDENQNVRSPCWTHHWRRAESDFTTRVDGTQGDRTIGSQWDIVRLIRRESAELSTENQNGGIAVDHRGGCHGGSVPCGLDADVPGVSVEPETITLEQAAIEASQIRREKRSKLQSSRQADAEPAAAVDQAGREDSLRPWENTILVDNLRVAWSAAVRAMNYCENAELKDSLSSIGGIVMRLSQELECHESMTNAVAELAAEAGNVTGDFKGSSEPEQDYSIEPPAPPASCSQPPRVGAWKMGYRAGWAAADKAATSTSSPPIPDSSTAVTRPQTVSELDTGMPASTPEQAEAFMDHVSSAEQLIKHLDNLVEHAGECAVARSQGKPEPKIPRPAPAAIPPTTEELMAWSEHSEIPAALRDQPQAERSFDSPPAEQAVPVFDARTAKPGSMWSRANGEKARFLAYLPDELPENQAQFHDIRGRNFCTYIDGCMWHPSDNGFDPEYKGDIIAPWPAENPAEQDRDLEIHQLRDDLKQANHWRARHARDAIDRGQQTVEQFEQIQKLTADLARVQASEGRLREALKSEMECGGIIDRVLGVLRKDGYADLYADELGTFLNAALAAKGDA